MKNLYSVIIPLLLGIVFISCTREIEYSKLQFRNNLAYEINSETPFSGKATEYYDKVTDKIKKEINYKDGVQDGLQREFYENGQLRLECSYCKGRREGSYVQYFENGQKFIEAEYSLGKYNGTVKQYYREGQILSVANYNHGVPHGDYCYYSPEGQVVQKAIFDKNRIYEELYCSFGGSTNKYLLKSLNFDFHSIADFVDQPTDSVLLKLGLPSTKEIKMSSQNKILISVPNELFNTLYNIEITPTLKEKDLDYIALFTQFRDNISYVSAITLSYSSYSMNFSDIITKGREILDNKIESVKSHVEQELSLNFDKINNPSPAAGMLSVAWLRKDKKYNAAILIENNSFTDVNEPRLYYYVTTVNVPVVPSN